MRHQRNKGESESVARAIEQLRANLAKSSFSKAPPKARLSDLIHVLNAADIEAFPHEAKEETLEALPVGTLRATGKRYTARLGTITERRKDRTDPPTVITRAALRYVLDRVDAESAARKAAHHAVIARLQLMSTENVRRARHHLCAGLGMVVLGICLAILGLLAPGVTGEPLPLSKGNCFAWAAVLVFGGAAYSLSALNEFLGARSEWRAAVGFDIDVEPVADMQVASIGDEEVPSGTPE